MKSFARGTHRGRTTASRPAEYRPACLGWCHWWMAEELPLDTVSHRATGPRLGGGRLAFGLSEEISGWLSAPTKSVSAGGQGWRVARISARSSTVVRGLMMHTRMAGSPSKVVGVSMAVPPAISRSHHA